MCTEQVVRRTNKCNLNLIFRNHRKPGPDAYTCRGRPRPYGTTRPTTDPRTAESRARNHSPRRRRRTWHCMLALPTTLCTGGDGYWISSHGDARTGMLTDVAPSNGILDPVHVAMVHATATPRARHNADRPILLILPCVRRRLGSTSITDANWSTRYQGR